MILLLLAFQTGCIAKAGPIVFGVGQVESCAGEYTYDDRIGRYHCQGDYVAGAPISETAGRALGVIGGAAVRAGEALGGVPSPRAVCPSGVCQ